MVLFLYVSIFTRESSARGSLTAVEAREVKIPVPAAEPCCGRDASVARGQGTRREFTVPRGQPFVIISR